MKHSAGSPMLSELLKRYYLRLGTKLISTALVVVLTFLSTFEGLAQVKKKGDQPAQAPSAPPPSSNPPAIDEDNPLYRNESFGLAYSSYDRDPGKLDDTDNARRRAIESSDSILMELKSRIVLGDFFRIFNDPLRHQGVLANASAYPHRLYASLRVSRDFDLPGSNMSRESNDRLQMFRINAIYEFGDPSDSRSSQSATKLANASLENNDAKDSFVFFVGSSFGSDRSQEKVQSSRPNFVIPRIFNSSMIGLHPFKTDWTAANNLNTTFPRREPMYRRFFMGDKSVTRGYNIRTIEPLATSIFSTFDSTRSSLVARPGANTNFFMRGLFESNVGSDAFKSVLPPSSSVITTAGMRIGEPAYKHFFLGNEFAIRGYNIRSVATVNLSAFDLNPLPQAATRGDEKIFAIGRIFSSAIGPFTPLSADITRIDFGPTSNADDALTTYEKAGNYHYSQGDYKQALSSYLQSWALIRESKDQAAQARLLMNIGVVYRALGESSKALESFNKAALVSLGTGQNNENPLLLYNIALANLDVGQTAKALSNFDRVAYQPKRSEKPDTPSNVLRGLALNGMGSVHASLGDSSQAISYFNQALRLFKESNDLSGQATALNNIGKLHNALGAYVNALDYLNEALSIRERLADQRGQADTLYDLGNVYSNLNERKQSADNYERSRVLFRKVNDRSGETLSLNGLGRIHVMEKKYLLALDDYNASLAIAREINNKRSIARTLTDLGRVYKKQGRQQEALASYTRALELTRGLGDKTNEAEDLYEMSLLNRDFGDFVQARGLVEAAIDIVESNRAKAPGPDLRSTYSASMQKCYALYISLLVSSHIKQPSEGFDAKAFEVSERARARSLLDLLAENHDDVRTGADQTLLEREHLAQLELNSAIAKQSRLLSGVHSEEEQTSVAKEVELAVREYQKIESTIKSQSPRYESLRPAQPLSTKEIQTQLLDENTLLLSYVLGDERSVLFAVTNNSLALYILPDRTVIETEARRAYELLANRPPSSASNTRGQTDIEGSIALERSQEANHRLGQMLLAPVVRSLGQKRLLVVADGALQIVPFAALAVPKSDTASSDLKEQPLIIDHEIVNLPSASVLAMLRKETASRKSPPKTIAIFADPVFAAGDARIKRSPSKSQITSEEAKINFDRLLFSRWEADQIAALVPASESLLATDFSASRITAISPALSQYRIVHFATHGTINKKQPEISSIVLSLFDEEGKPQNGFLRLSEIYDMNLPVDLVVLSGCRTGLGQEIPGEGLKSITQGFMYAGAARVVFSLWAVDDRVTAELMVRFYRKMLSKKLPAAEALRETQVEMLRDDRWSSPYFWAPFVLQGDFK